MWGYTYRDIEWMAFSTFVTCWNLALGFYCAFHAFRDLKARKFWLGAAGIMFGLVAFYWFGLRLTKGILNGDFP